MTNFRILQTQLLSDPLPYGVEELVRVWYRLRPVWRSVKEQYVPPFTFKAAARRFQTPKEASLFIERLLAEQARQREEEKLRQQKQCQRQKLPRVVQEFNAAALG